MKGKIAVEVLRRPIQSAKTAEKGCKSAQNTGFARREFTFA